MTRKIALIVGCLVVVLGVAGCIGLCRLWQDTIPAATAKPSLEGYWMPTNVYREAIQYGEAMADQRATVDFWRLQRIADAETPDEYEITGACSGKFLGYAVVVDEGFVVIANNNGASIEAVLASDDVLVATQPVTQGAWSARRVQQPTCDPNSEVVPLQPIETIDTTVMAEIQAAIEKQKRTWQGTGTLPNGMAHLKAAAGSRLASGGQSTTGGPTSSKCYDGGGKQIDCPNDVDGGHPTYSVCEESTVDEQTVVQLAESVCMIDSTYPGQLIRGQYFDAGQFVPITIPRAGGSILLSGLFGKSGSWGRTVPEVAPTGISDAISSILRDNQITGTAACGSVQMYSAETSEELAVNLGVDVSFLSGSVKSEVDTNRSASQSITVVYFTQVYYTVDFETPVLQTSVFRDGENFDDPENQIGAGNPPLYISSVKYGRQVFLVLKSAYSSLDVQATLKADYGVVTKGEVRAGVTYEDVMQNTSITYVVRGGPADLALQAMQGQTLDKVFQNVKDYIANKNAADWSFSSPGLPVAFTVNYLSDRTVAAKALMTSYTNHDCTLHSAEMYHFAVEFDWVDDDAYAYLDTNPDSGGNLNTLLEIHFGQKNLSRFFSDILDDKDHMVYVRLHNGPHAGAAVMFKFLRDNVCVYKFDYNDPSAANNADVAKLSFKINRASGKFEVLDVWPVPTSSE
ncbi:MAG: thiol-activated cytolysin family protein [Phycisphaerae bacterium]|nr:thiol-activated cytolysin family protein [Phycisphaerae bacterium]